MRPTLLRVLNDKNEFLNDMTSDPQQSISAKCDRRTYVQTKKTEYYISSLIH